jgi:alcohol dehydrogenase-like protein
MKAAVVPAVSSSWQIKDVAQPQPGTNQVLVKMHASGICYTDVHETLGHIPGQFPRILGHEPVRSLPWLPTSPHEKWATAWARPGFSPRVDVANGANAAARCSAPI